MAKRPLGPSSRVAERLEPGSDRSCRTSSPPTNESGHRLSPSSSDAESMCPSGVKATVPQSFWRPSTIERGPRMFHREGDPLRLVEVSNLRSALAERVSLPKSGTDRRPPFRPPPPKAERLPSSPGSRPDKHQGGRADSAPTTHVSVPLAAGSTSEPSPSRIHEGRQ